MKDTTYVAKASIWTWVNFLVNVMTAWSLATKQVISVRKERWHRVIGLEERT